MIPSRGDATRLLLPTRGLPLYVRLQFLYTSTPLPCCNDAPAHNRVAADSCRTESASMARASAHSATMTVCATLSPVYLTSSLARRSASGSSTRNATALPTSCLIHDISFAHVTHVLVDQVANHALVGRVKPSACSLKKSTLSSLKVIVTFTPLLRITSSSGRGKKFGHTLAQLDRFVGVLSCRSFLAHIAFCLCANNRRANDPNFAAAPCEAHSQNAPVRPAQQKVAILCLTVFGITRDDTRGGARNASCACSNATPCLRWFSLFFCSSHSKVGSIGPILAKVWLVCNIFVWGS